MFRHLRNRLIIINLAVTTAVLIAAFSMIYVVARDGAEHRQSIAADIMPGYTQIIVQTLNERIQFERSQALNSLLVSLIIVGLSIEVAVAILSYALAEIAIRPVKEAYESQKVFIANASHEMKTPIAAIMANLEVADIQGNPWIDNVSHEVKSLADLNQDLLQLARAENAMTLTKTAESVNLKELVNEAITPFRPRLQQQKIHFQLKTQVRSGKVKLAKNDFLQIISILMDNALKYCDKNITVYLTMKSISVENDGTIISPDNLERIFERFYQADKSAEGVGLGLSIAKLIAKRHDWKLSVQSSQTTKFTLEF